MAKTLDDYSLNGTLAQLPPTKLVLRIWNWHSADGSLPTTHLEYGRILAQCRIRDGLQEELAMEKQARFKAGIQALLEMLRDREAGKEVTAIPAEVQEGWWELREHLSGDQPRTVNELLYGLALLPKEAQAFRKAARLEIEGILAKLPTLKLKP